MVVILLVTSININCFNKGFYKTEYASLETAQSLGMTEKDLNKATDALLDYLQDRRDNIDVTVAVKGTETKAFNARESSHMVDVRNLYRFAMVLRNVAIILLVLSLVYMAVRLKSGMLTLDFDHNAVFRYIYSFHMPLFMCVSGFVSYKPDINF